jgi:membrane-bound lytic murein transglycosylase D
MKLRLITLFGVLPLLPLALPAQKADSAPAPAKQASRTQAVETAQPATPAAAESPDTRQLYDAAKQLFDQYAPDELKDEYEFPSHEHWEQFAQRLQQALQGGSMAELAAFEPEVRKAIAAFRMIPDYEDYADWLTERLDLIETARIAVEEPSTVKPPSSTPGPKSNVVVVPVPEPHLSPDTKITPQPEPKPEVKVAARLPYYDVWLKRASSRGFPRWSHR